MLVRLAHALGLTPQKRRQDRRTPKCYISFLMEFKKVEKDWLECTTSVARPFGCMELWAGNERAHRSLELAGLETDVIAVPSGCDKGGDLSAIFSCSDNIGVCG